jgi:Fe-S-cluster containining protein
MAADRVPVKLEFSMCDRTIDAEASIPNVPLRVADLLPVLFAFDDAVVAMAADQIASEGANISCRSGCGACCRQLVPVSEAEAMYLAGVVSQLPEPKQGRVRARFQEALAAVESLLPELRNTASFTTTGQCRELGMRYLALGAACPFLEDESCSIYAHRPLRCREYLVISPPVNCARPTAETIQAVNVPVKLSEILYRFADGMGRDDTRWIPLVLALEWEERHKDEPQKYFPGPALFENFVARAKAREPVI